MTKDMEVGTWKANLGAKSRANSPIKAQCLGPTIFEGAHRNVLIFFFVIKRKKLIPSILDYIWFTPM